MWLQHFDRRRSSPAQIALLEATSIALGIPRTTGDNSQQKFDYAAITRVLEEDFYGSIGGIMSNADTISDADALELGHVLERGRFDFKSTFTEGGQTRELHDAVMYVIKRLAQQKNRIPVTVDHVAVAMDGSMLSYAALDAAAHVRKHGTLFVVHIVADEEMPAVARGHLLTDVRRKCINQYKIPEDKLQVLIIESGNKHDCSDSSVYSQMQANELQAVLKEHNVNVLALGMQGQRKSIGLGHLAAWATDATNTFACLLTNVCSRKCELDQQRIAYKFLLPLPEELQTCERFDTLWASSLRMMQPGDSLLVLCLLSPREEELYDLPSDNQGQEGFLGTLQDIAASTTFDVALRTRTLEQQSTAAQEALQVVEQEGIHAILLPRGARDICLHVEECCGAARCTVILV